ncbi:TrmB family transcriptional regulator [Bifidobacterium anseris]|uniref:TrmB family transcriptional regulator n=1 Tax=Bifidobacterium anseris TaxID=2020963 RepID=A0A2N5IX94_9BIFI|nr:MULTISPECIES: MarR family transcriptional regulator [Bifidobacterium]PLS26587.1 TrmB family transcriptional regulator [Bifidobacterium anseris]
MELIGPSVVVLMRQLNVFLGRHIREANMTASELMYLAPLYEEDGLTQERLSAVLAVNKAATARIVRKLESKNLVLRRTQMDDRRSKRIWLTPQAKALEPTIRGLRDEWDAYVTQGMTDEEVSFLERRLAHMAERAKQLNATQANE